MTGPGQIVHCRKASAISKKDFTINGGWAVAAALLTEKGNIYVGVCIDSACSLGMCAERNAIANMITNGEDQIVKIVAVLPEGKAGMPCGACREFMMQMNKAAERIEVLCSYEPKKTVQLKRLIPDWWSTK